MTCACPEAPGHKISLDYFVDFGCESDSSFTPVGKLHILNDRIPKASALHINHLCRKEICPTYALGHHLGDPRAPAGALVTGLAALDQGATHSVVCRLPGSGVGSCR